jgi:hypothetical protein
MLPDMAIATPQRSDWAKYRVTICFVVDAYSLVSILLIIKLEGSPIRRCNGAVGSVACYLSQLSLRIPLEERNILQLELYGLFRLIPTTLDGVLPHSEEVVKRN